MSQDVIDQLIGDSLELRNHRPITKEQTQASYEALFEPQNPGSFTKLERFAVALFVAALHCDAQAQAFYAKQLREISPPDVDIVDNIEQAAASALTIGPYGNYPDGLLSRENKAGVNWQADEQLVTKIGKKLKAALEHAHFLTFHPRDAARERLENLTLHGFDVAAIVTLSQLIAFLTYQLRIAHGLRVLSLNAA